MKTIEYRAQGVCAKLITLTIDDEGLVRNVSFMGGCNGNLKAVSKLVEGMEANKVIEILEGNTCGYKTTSCADQLTKAIKEALK